VCFIVQTDLLKIISLWVQTDFHCIFPNIEPRTPTAVLYRHLYVVANVESAIPRAADGVQRWENRNPPVYLCVFSHLIDVRQLTVIPVPVAFQVEPVLSFVVWVGSVLKPPAE